LKTDALEALSAIPFILSGREALTAKEWCFILSFDWGTPYGLTPTLALKILRLALENGIIEEQDGQLKMTKPISIRPLFFHGKKIDFGGLKDVQPYALNLKLEVSREEAKEAAQGSLQKTAARKATPLPSESTAKHEKPRKTKNKEEKTRMEERTEKGEMEEKREEERKFKQATLF